MNTLETYLDELHAFKERLFGLYAAEGAELAHKDLPRAEGTTWGYALLHGKDIADRSN